MQDTYSYLAILGIALFNLLIFPGGIFALSLGVLFKGLDRKIVARMQRRVGPPIIQPVIDIVKLSGKEAMVPETAQRPLFQSAPLLGFIGMAVCAALLPIPGVSHGLPYMGDMLVYFYLIQLPAVALMIAGSSSSSPFGTLGFSREMTLMFAYEIPLLMVILAVAMKVGGDNFAEFSLMNIINYQEENGQFITNWVMLPAFIAYLFFLPGTMGFPPFDIPEAETEIVEGPLLEYSGASLALFQLTSALKSIVVFGFGVVIFFPMTLGDNILVNILWFAFKCFVLMLISCTIVKSATGRFRIEQAFGFYLKIPALLAAISLILVWLGY